MLFILVACFFIYDSGGLSFTITMGYNVWAASMLPLISQSLPFGDFNGFFVFFDKKSVWR
jgi:hypothetical protein